MNEVLLLVVRSNGNLFLADNLNRESRIAKSYIHIGKLDELIEFGQTIHGGLFDANEYIPVRRFVNMLLSDARNIIIRESKL